MLSLTHKWQRDSKHWKSSQTLLENLAVARNVDPSERLSIGYDCSLPSFLLGKSISLLFLLLYNDHEPA